MTDMSLFYESDVTIPSVYGTPMTSGTVTVDAETSTQAEIDRRRTAWMVAAQAGDRAAYESYATAFRSSREWRVAKEYDRI
jgi:hypothetical protein